MIRITPDSAARIAAAVKRIEKQSHGKAGSDGRASYPHGLLPFVRIATTGSGGIPAGGGITSPASGPITLYDWPTGASPVVDRLDTGWNFATGSRGVIGGNKTVVVGWVCGRWVVLDADCS